MKEKTEWTPKNIFAAVLTLIIIGTIGFTLIYMFTSNSNLKKNSIKYSKIIVEDELNAKNIDFSDDDSDYTVEISEGVESKYCVVSGRVTYTDAKGVHLNKKYKCSLDVSNDGDYKVNYCTIEKE